MLREGWFRDKDGNKVVQAMAYQVGEKLSCDTTSPPGLDINADPAAAAAAAPAPAPAAPAKVSDEN
jgi:hypothetical protein